MKSPLIAAMCCVLLSVTNSRADVLNWLTDSVIPGTESITPGPGVQLANWNTDSHNLKYAILDHYTLTGSSFANSWLNGTSFGTSDLTNANLSGANLSGAYFEWCKASGANFTNATISGTEVMPGTTDVSGMTYLGLNGFTSTQLYSTASYKNKNLSYIYFSGTLSMMSLDMRGQNLTSSYMGSMTLTGTNFTGANLTGAKMFNCNVQSVNFTDAVVKGASLESAYNLTKEQIYSTASYKNKDLGSISLTYANMPSCNLSGQNMIGATLYGATLTGANLSNANLTDASLSNANLTSANMTGADLTHAILSGANLTGVTGTANRHNTIWVDRTFWLDNSTPGFHLVSGERFRMGMGTVTMSSNGAWQMDQGSLLNMTIYGSTATAGLTMNDIVDLGGTLQIDWRFNSFDPQLIGKEFRIFNWNGHLAAGDCFDSVVINSMDPRYTAVWDTSRLYTDGVIVLTEVPEPMTLALLAVGVAAVRRMRGA
jgi:uncharacterized protein YjbI with pentapeptide repeats